MSFEVAASAAWRVGDMDMEEQQKRNQGQTGQIGHGTQPPKQKRERKDSQKKRA